MILQLIRSDQTSSKRLELTEEGRQVAENGSHEAVVYSAVPPDGGILQAQLMVRLIIHLLPLPISCLHATFYDEVFV